MVVFFLVPLPLSYYLNHSFFPKSHCLLIYYCICQQINLLRVCLSTFYLLIASFLLLSSFCTWLQYLSLVLEALRSLCIYHLSRLTSQTSFLCYLNYLQFTEDTRNFPSTVYLFCSFCHFFGLLHIIRFYLCPMILKLFFIVLLGINLVLL